jgi:hypothetical protein
VNGDAEAELDRRARSEPLGMKSDAQLDRLLGRGRTRQATKGNEQESEQVRPARDSNGLDLSRR